MAASTMIWLAMRSKVGSAVTRGLKSLSDSILALSIGVEWEAVDSERAEHYYYLLEG